MLTGGTDRDLFTVEVTEVDFVVFGTTAPDAGTTGGVEDPNRDGIEIDDSDDVEETGEGIAVTLVDNPLLDVVFVLVVGANKFDIVGEFFLLLVDDDPPDN